MKLFARLLIIGPLGVCATATGGVADAGEMGEHAAPPAEVTLAAPPAEAQPAAPPAEAQPAAPPAEAQPAAPPAEAQPAAPPAETRPAAPPAEAIAETTTAPGGEVAAPQGEPNGIIQLIGDALSQVCLSDEQRASIEHLGNAVSAYDQEVQDARSAFMLALIDQIASGKIDRCALYDAEEAVVTAHKEANPIIFGGLAVLHGILDEGQREAFVDALYDEMDTLGQRFTSGEKFGAWSAELGLNEEQRDKIRAVLDEVAPAFQDEIDQMKMVLDAFRGEDFAPEDILPLSETGHRVRERAELFFKIADVLASTLTPEQRNAAAERLRGKLD